jgi:hypothetical protein
MTNKWVTKSPICMDCGEIIERKSRRAHPLRCEVHAELYKKSPEAKQAHALARKTYNQSPKAKTKRRAASKRARIAARPYWYSEWKREQTIASMSGEGYPPAGKVAEEISTWLVAHGLRPYHGKDQEAVERVQRMLARETKFDAENGHARMRQTIKDFLYEWGMPQAEIQKVDLLLLPVNAEPQKFDVYERQITRRGFHTMLKGMYGKVEADTWLKGHTAKLAVTLLAQNEGKVMEYFLEMQRNAYANVAEQYEKLTGNPLTLEIFEEISLHKIVRRKRPGFTRLKLVLKNEQ